MGVWRIVGMLYRPDKVAPPRAHVPVRPIAPGDGWCDAPGDPNYNRPVDLPYPASHERLWRDDGLYDVVVVLDYNLARRSQGRGSCIFMHIARPGLSPTAGCVALARQDLLRLLAAPHPPEAVEIVG